MELWHAWDCPDSMRVRAVLAEKGVPYRSREVDLGERTPEFLQVGRNGTVPVLVDGGERLGNALDIVERLDARYPEPPLLAPAPGWQSVRGTWLRVDLLLATAVPQALRGRGETRQNALEEVRRALVEFDIVVGDGEYLCGRFSAADLALASFVARLPRGLRPAALGLAGLSRWERAVMSRPAVRDQMGPHSPTLA